MHGSYVFLFITIQKLAKSNASILLSPMKQKSTCIKLDLPIDLACDYCKRKMDPLPQKNAKRTGLICRKKLKVDVSIHGIQVLTPIKVNQLYMIK